MGRIHGVEDILLGFEPKDAGSIPAGSVFFLNVFQNIIKNDSGFISELEVRTEILITSLNVASERTVSNPKFYAMMNCSQKGKKHAGTNERYS